MTDDFDRVAVIDVARHFGRRKALSRINFTCAAGDLVGLLGPNGAGKSTLLSILATLAAPSEGRVEYGGRTSAAAGARLRGRIGLVGHDLFLYPELTARENLTFFARLHGLSEVAGTVQRALDRAGLAARADEPIAGFSRGMRQRVALERALQHDPRLILLDEPFTGLDQASAAALVARLQAHQRGGAIIIAATHDLDVVDGVLSHALYLRGGRLVGADERPDGLADRYRRAIGAEPAPAARPS